MRQPIAFIGGCATVMTVVGFANGAALNSYGNGVAAAAVRTVVREGSVRSRSFSFVIGAGTEQYVIPAPASASTDGAVDFDSMLDGLIDEEVAADLVKLRRQVGATSDGEVASLRNLRLQAGLSQKEMASLLGTGQGYISRLERGEIKDPATSRAEAIADALGIDVLKVLAAFRVLRTNGA